MRSRQSAISWSPTLLIAIVAILTFFVPGLAELFELDWPSVKDGEAWRIVTGHWTHYGLSHLFWDLLMFVGLGLICERRSMLFTTLCTFASMVLISISLPAFYPEITAYRGLSGVDSALFVLLLTMIASESRERNVWTSMLAGIGLLGFISKVLFEIITGTTYFVDSQASGFVPLPAAHLVGAGVGFLFGVLVATQSSHQFLKRQSRNVLPLPKLPKGERGATYEF